MGGGLGGGRSYLPRADGRIGAPGETVREGDGDRALADGDAAQMFKDISNAQLEKRKATDRRTHCARSTSTVQSLV